MKKLLSAAAGAVLLFAAGHAAADDFQPKAQGKWMVDFRLTDVAPDASDAITTAAGAPTGLNVDVSNSYIPSLGINYFLTDNISAELVLGTSHHTIKAKGGATNVTVHKTWVLPPALTAVYHFNPKERFSPYVGAGVDLMLFYGGKDENGFTVKVKNGLGGVLQGGFDYATNGPWSLNVDVKKIFFETDANINSGALKSKVNLDPWVVSVGFGRKF